MSYVTRKLNTGQVNELILLRRCGWPITKIAKRYNISSSAVNYRLKGTKPFTAEQLMIFMKVSPIFREAA